MRKKNHENFIAKLMMTKDIIDAAELEKHIRNVVGYDKSLLVFTTNYSSIFYKQ